MSSDEEGSVEFEMDPFDKEWGELDAAQQKAAALLGGSDGDWPPKRDWPAWGALSDPERAAAEALSMDEDAWPPENADSSDEELPEWGSDEEDDDAFATTAEDEAARSKKARKDDDVPSVQAMAVDGQAYTLGALKTIASELKWMAKSDDATRGWRGGPMGDDVGQWQLDVPAESVPADLPLRGDMARLGCPAITMHIIFPPDYPFRPPFMRVVRPRFAFRTGHVTIGGSICIELLTNASWNPLYRLEGVMTHVLSTIYGEPGDPPARLDERNRSDYSTGEAMDAFRRLLATHGWSHWLKSI